MKITEEDIREKPKPKKETLDLYQIFTGENIIIKSVLIHLFAIIVKVFVGLYGYSGRDDPPKFGDYEAQRHWMELTLNLPVSKWYTNSTKNPDDYWPMDYPPMSGYHSYVCGFILKLFIPESVKLIDSYGYESEGHKMLMRLFALLSDVIIYHIAVQVLMKVLFLEGKTFKNYVKYYTGLIVFLLSPCLIIIDHGHFQFNSVMHGFFIHSVYMLLTEEYILAILYFSFAINFKIMGLYYIIPFPVYVLKKLFFSGVIDKRKKFNNIIKVIGFAFFTIFTNSFIWLPWIYNNNYKDVLKRIFPVWRGIFEDKVANFWCVLNILVKIKNIPTSSMLKISTLFTIASNVLPVVCIIMANKQRLTKITKLAFFICSFGFYLFSFHVHEKTIMVPYLGFLICLFEMRNYLFSFSLFSMFSMYPLLKREDQIISYFILNLVFGFLSLELVRLVNNMKKIRLEEKQRQNPFKKLEKKYIWFVNLCSLTIIIVYHILEIRIPPPEKYPWLYPMINAFFSFAYFISIFIIANLKIAYFTFKKLEKMKIL